MPAGSAGELTNTTVDQAVQNNTTGNSSLDPVALAGISASHRKRFPWWLGLALGLVVLMLVTVVFFGVHRGRAVFRRACRGGLYLVGPGGPGSQRMDEWGPRPSIGTPALPSLQVAYVDGSPVHEVQSSPIPNHCFYLLVLISTTVSSILCTSAYRHCLGL